MTPYWLTLAAVMTAAAVVLLPVSILLGRLYMTTPQDEYGQGWRLWWDTIYWAFYRLGVRLKLIKPRIGR